MKRGKRTENKGKLRGKLFAPLLAALLFFTGAGVFFYPTVSNYFAEREQISVIREYQAQMETGSTEDLEAEWEKAEAYNENLAGDPV